MTRKQKKTLIRIIVSVVLTGVAWAVDEIFGLEGWKELLLYIAPYLVIGYDVLWDAIRNIAHGQVFDEHFLMAIATVGAFGVGDAITREQLVTILYRYAAYKGIDVSARADLSGYRDAEKISGYARDAFGWAVEAGLIRGSGDLLNPQGRTTRAEYAAIAARFHKTFIAK